MKMLKWLTRIGPAFVIAAVVLGPGSVTTMTKLGASYGYAMLWLPLLTGCLMAGFVTLFMRFGISADKSFLAHCSDTWGRWFAALCGFSMFYVATAFQFGNNLGVATAMNSLLTSPASAAGTQATQPTVAVPAWVWPVVFNAVALAFLFAFRSVYSILERMMTALVAVMLAAFFVNLFLIRPNLAGIARGLLPSLPEGLDWALVAGAVATTFSIVGAIFQTYLVRARGWRREDFGKGVADSVSGIGMLALISMTVLITSAAVLHPRGLTVKGAGDMAGQLAAFGVGARVIFCVGFAAAAFSSFLVNAMIGGTLLSDGFGLSEDVNSMPAKLCSAASLLIGMVVAILVTYWERIDFAQALVAAQAGTLLAVPLAILATLLVLLYPRRAGVKRPGAAATAFVLLGLAVLAALVVYSFPRILAQLAKVYGG
jgi:Mn2+/Fe2+ NRAMP family transporter